MTYRPAAALALFAALSFPATTAASEDDDPPDEEPAITVTTTPESPADEEKEDQTEEGETVTTTARAPLPRFAAPRNVGVVDEDDVLARHSVSLAGTVGFSIKNHHQLRPGSRGGQDLFMTSEQDGRLLGSEYGQTLFNLRGTYALDEHFRLKMSATNLTDRRYQHHGSGVFGPGLQAMVTLVYEQ